MSSCFPDAYLPGGGKRKACSLGIWSISRDVDFAVDVVPILFLKLWSNMARHLSATCNVTLSVEDPNNLCDLTSAKELEVFANNTLYQNVPNPVSGSTSIGFELSEATSAKLSIVDINGVLIKQISGVFDEGYNSLLIEDLHVKGLLFYTLETKTFTATKKMIVVE